MCAVSGKTPSTSLQPHRVGWALQGSAHPASGSCGYSHGLLGLHRLHKPDLGQGGGKLRVDYSSSLLTYLLLLLFNYSFIGGQCHCVAIALCSHAKFICDLTLYFELVA